MRSHSDRERFSHALFIISHSQKTDKSTRFAEGTKSEPSGRVKKAVLARDHSLGREYLQAGEQVSLDGFSWQDPFQTKKKEASHPAPPPPPPHAAYPPAGRNCDTRLIRFIKLDDENSDESGNSTTANGDSPSLFQSLRSRRRGSGAGLIDAA